MIDFAPRPYVPIYTPSQLMSVIFPQKEGPLFALVSNYFSFNPLGTLAPLSYPLPTMMCKPFSLREDKYFVQEQQKALCQLRTRRKTTQMETYVCHLELDTHYL